MLWSALLPQPNPGTAPPPTDGAAAQQRALAIWALQFTPRVALADEAVLMEVDASVRLFGGRRALRDRVLTQGRELGLVARLAWAPNGLAALALARAGIENGLRRSLAEQLDALPMATLSAVQPHRRTLEHIGCRTLGDLRALPRGGIARRFDATLLRALDQAYGHAPEAHTWVTLPEHFEERLELMARVEQAPALLFGARRLLHLLAAWLAARRAGVTAFTLRWAHDAMRARAAGEGGELTLRTAEPTRDVEHLCRLLAEHLARVALAAPVGELTLRATEVMPLHGVSASLLPDTVHQGEKKLGLVLERLAARLGPQRVVRPVLCEDHRPEHMCHWQPAALPLPRKGAPGTDLPQPGFILPQPLRLLMQDHRPVYHGALVLLLGPQRVEAGWWDRPPDANGSPPCTVVRDYWVALSPEAGVVWVFQARLEEGTAWFLHGHFA
ncbi:DNA polymerase Y family protein [Hydrogenophaga sp.]|uniref:Y-family DNA polymerase n=1 Tax=Hydrogenophaga sp. TaxID=1904254 RepID=UPI002633F458|nr:DNA polymerase Y family protein [Hydrogenophaga sp.]MCW5655589.1 DNA polymerase Y family protein [Hydrogenophaga sp.]